MGKRSAIALWAGGVAVAVIAAGNAWATPPASSGSGSGNLAELTVRVTEHMAGGPAIPPRTIERKICMQPEGFSPEALQNSKQRASKMCKITHYEKQGNTVTFDQMCKAHGEDITSHGVFHLGTGFNFTGTTHTAMNAMGHAVTVDAAYTGKRIGSCTYTPPAASAK